MSGKNSPSKTRWRSLKYRIGWTIAGIVIPVLYLAWHIFAWPEPIRISYETTRLTEPLTADGYVDFLKVIRDQRKQYSDPNNEPWFVLFENEREAALGPNDFDKTRPRPKEVASIVYRDPVEAFRKSLDETQSAIEQHALVRQYEDEVLPRRMIVPFTTDDDPLLAATVEANTDWYDAVVATYQPTPLPVVFPSATDARSQQTAGDILFPMLGNYRLIVQRFQLRSMLRAGRGEMEDAIQDIEFIYRIAARFGSFAVEQSSSAFAAELRASRSAISLILRAEKLTPTACKIIESLPQRATVGDLADDIDKAERYVWLDIVQGLHAGKMHDSDFIKITGQLAYFKERRVWHAVDWSRVLQNQNQYFDQIIATAKLPSWQEQNAAAMKLAVSLQSSDNSMVMNLDDEPPWSVIDPTDTLISIICRQQTWLGDPIRKAHQRDLRRRVVQIVARLAMLRQINGEFPAELESVLTADGFSQATEELLKDPFTNGELAYESSGDAFILSSVGPNMVRNESGTEETSTGDLDFDPQGSDDDLIWRWPPRE